MRDTTNMFHPAEYRLGGGHPARRQMNTAISVECRNLLNRLIISDRSEVDCQFSA